MKKLLLSILLLGAGSAFANSPFDATDNGLMYWYSPHLHTICFEDGSSRGEEPSCVSATTYPDISMFQPNKWVYFPSESNS